MRLGPSLLALGLLVLLGHGSGCGWKLETRGPEGSAGAGSAEPERRVEAPSFSLANDDGIHVSLDELLAAGKPAILVFYRGHW